MNGVVRGLPTRFLRAQRCENCKFLGPANSGQRAPTCRHNPPQSQLVTAMVEGKAGPEMQVLGSVSWWPEVPMEEFCHQWVQRIVTAQTLDQATAQA